VKWEYSFVFLCLPRNAFSISDEIQSKSIWMATFYSGAIARNSSLVLTVLFQMLGSLHRKTNHFTVFALQERVPPMNALTLNVRVA
jgi:hypothetical protein